MESKVKRNSSSGNCEFEKKKKKRNDYESVSESRAESGDSSASYSSYEATSSEEVKKKNDNIGCDSISQSPLDWPTRKAGECKTSLSSYTGDENQENNTHLDHSKFEQLSPEISEIDMMKEKYAKLLLGEDMSGSGKGVCTALAISNSITNLYVTVFGQLWRLEPLPSEKKSMWRREMECLLCVSDHIMELIPSWQTIPDGTKLEVMTCRQRSDLLIDLPALRKLENMLLEILENFANSEFWYVDQGIVADGSTSFQKTIHRQEDKWWLPVPRVPAGGLSYKSRKQLNHTRKFTSQILKAAKAINTIALAEMDVPNSYLETLPKNGRACLGDMIYQYITSVQFSSECLIDCLDVSTEHVAEEIANRVESAIHVWRRRVHSKNQTCSNRSNTRSPWNMVKELMVYGDKRGLLTERAESLLLSLKQRFPSLSQTSLDTSKIQFNKDVGKSIIGSYSRVVESLAYNIVARIDDLIHVDELIKHSDKLAVSEVKAISDKKVTAMPYSSVPVSGTPLLQTTPSFSGSPFMSAASGERTPFLDSTNISINSNKIHHCVFRVKNVLTKQKRCGSSGQGTGKEGQEEKRCTAQTRKFGSWDSFMMERLLL